MRKSATKNPYIILITVFVIWRIFLEIPLLVSNNIPIRSGYLYQPTLNHLFFPWANFDGIHYLDIAQNGYSSNGRFFPFYPILINVAAKGIGMFTQNTMRFFFSGLFMSNLFFLCSLFLLYRLLRIDYSRKVVFTTILFLLIFPTSFFFGAVYSESLFLFFSLLSLYFARKKDWFKSGVTAAVASSIRFTGIILIPVLLIEMLLTKPKKITTYLFLSIASLGTLFYSLYNYYRWGDFLTFVHLQGELHNGRTVNSIILPVQTVFRYLKILTTVSPHIFEWWIALFEISVFTGVCLLFLVMWQKKIRFSYFVFALLGTAIPTLTGTFSGLPRYIIPLFPFFLAVALIQNKYIKTGIAVLCFILLTLLVAFFAQGYFIA